MAAWPNSLVSRGLYWTLALAVVLPAATAVEGQTRQKPAKAKTSKPASAPAEHDPLTEWELINGAAAEARVRFRNTLERDREPVREEIAALAVRSAAGAERALAIGDASLFDSYRRQFREQFHDRRWRVGRMAQRGSGAAEYALGVMALHGFLAPAEVEAACRHFGAALEKKFLAARFRHSQCLEKTDPARAAALLREAADAGHPVAAELLGRACLEARPPQAECARERLTLAAASGRPSAQSALAWMYAQGIGGKVDPVRATRLYLAAARAGDATAQNNAGELYETGRGVAADPKQALEWYRKAAEAGFAPGQFNLGRLHAEGKVVPRDFAEARVWLEKAERGGIAAARVVMDWMEKEKNVVK